MITGSQLGDRLAQAAFAAQRAASANANANENSSAAFGNQPLLVAATAAFLCAADMEKVVQVHMGSERRQRPNRGIKQNKTNIFLMIIHFANEQTKFESRGIKIDFYVQE